jgi:hypothetical protein
MDTTIQDEYVEINIIPVNYVTLHKQIFTKQKQLGITLTKTY